MPTQKQATQAKMRIKPIVLNSDAIKNVRVSHELSVVIEYRTRVGVMKLTSLLERKINPHFLKHGQIKSELTP